MNWWHGQKCAWRVTFNFGWAVHAMAQDTHFDLDAVGERIGIVATVTTNLSSLVGIPGLSLEQWSSFINILNNKKSSPILTIFLVR